MIRPLSTALALALLCCIAVAPAEARKHTAKPDTQSDKPAATKTETKPTQIGSFGDWNAYLAKSKTKTCYTLASPKERKPDVKREAAYVFIADRPAEKVHNEVSIIMGFPMKEGGAPQAKIGANSFDLVAKGSNAWIKNPADETKFVEALKHSGRLVVKAAPTRGPATTDVYALAGLKQALERVDKECK